MASPRNLSHPPIVEALVDFRASIDVEQSALETFAQRALKGTFPLSEVRNSLQATLEVRDGRVVPPKVDDQGFHGIWSSNADKTKVVQFRRNGFTLNHVRHYLGGDVLTSEALDLWSQFTGAFGPVSVERVALRFINKLVLPYRPGDDFNRFLTSAPPMPPELPQLVAEFLTRVVASEDAGNGAANRLIVTQHLQGENGKPAVVLDIDVFREGRQEPDQLRSTLDSLRSLKNRAFFALLTEAAVDLYE